MIRGQNPRPEVAMQADKRRQEVMNFAMKRKQEFIGARVPKALKSQIIKCAEELDIPVSLLLRRVLEEVFLDGEARRQPELLNSLRREAENPSNKQLDQRFEQVLGWNRLELNRTVICDSCGQEMAVGQLAYAGVGSQLQSPLMICAVCKGSK